MGSFHIPGNTELAYIHIPRTGLGIKKIIENWFRPNFSQYYVQDWMINHPNLKMIKDQIPTAKTFSVIRNPWMRVFSLYRKIQREGYWLDWNGFDSRSLKHFNDWLEDYADPNWNFEFPRWFDRWTQMSEFIEYKDLEGNKFSVDFLLRAENLEEDIQVITDYLNCKIPIPDISMHYENRDYRKHYTDKGAECVYKVYERDIIKYGYTF